MIGFGVDYSGAKIHGATAKPGMEQPVKYWVPSISPSGAVFYTGKLFPKWDGSLFTGALSGRMLVHSPSTAMPSPARSGCCRT